MSADRGSETNLRRVSLRSAGSLRLEAVISFRAWNPKATARYDSVHDHYHDATSGRRLRIRLYHLQDLAANGFVDIR